MKTRSISSLAGLAISLTILNGLCAPAQAVVLGPELVTNGYFSTNSAASGGFTSGWTNCTTSCPGSPSVTTATGWNFGVKDNNVANFLVKTGQSDIFTTGKGPTGQQGYLFSQYLVLYGSGSLPSPDATVNPWFVLADADSAYNSPITQAINLTAGEQYQVSFYQSSAQENQGQSAIVTDRWAVNLGSATLSNSTSNVTSTSVGQLSDSMTPPNNGTTTTGAGTTTTGVNTWQKETMTFTAASTGSQALSFLAVGGPSGKPPMALLTGVSVKRVVIPEPAEYIGTLAGIGSVVLLRKRLKRK